MSSEPFQLPRVFRSYALQTYSSIKKIRFDSCLGYSNTVLAFVLGILILYLNCGAISLQTGIYIPIGVGVD